MLGPEHVRVRRRGETLRLVPLEGAERRRAQDLAEQLLAVARDQIGHVREQVELAWAEIAYEPKERRLYEGLVKLVSDACEFGALPELDPAELRRRVFSAASEQRQGLSQDASFDRQEIIDRIAGELGISAEALERGLYADLKGAQRLEAVPAQWTSATLVDAYERGQLQAALLRAVSVRLIVRCTDPAGYRRLFHRLKFQRLLYRIERLPDGSHQVDVDGPFSLFESVTKYGLQLASLVPALLECDHVSLEADLRWGKTRKPGKLIHELRGASTEGEPLLRDDVAALLGRVQATAGPWRARPCSDVLDLPGVGLCVPDLVFERVGYRPVYFEVLGFWSRDAVWRRVELAEGGLEASVVFAVSTRLRVSEAVLEGHESSALYVYKGSMSPRAVLEKVASVARPDDPS